MNETFSEDDLAPSPHERRERRGALVDRAASTAAALAVGVTVGGTFALGACAAPFVFQLAPAPFAGDAMGAAFARFDQIAIALSVVLLGAEVARTFVARRERPPLSARARRLAAILFAGCTAYMGLVLSPGINSLHRAGARRGVGPEGAELEAIHQRASAVGKAEAVLGLLLVGLHVFTVRSPRRDDEEDDDAPAPLPPGSVASGLRRRAPGSETPSEASKAGPAASDGGDTAADADS